MDDHVQQHTRSRRSDLSPLGLLIGPVIGFFGPLVTLELVDRVTAHPAEESTVLAFALPLLLASTLTAAPGTRRWGWWLLAGAAIGEACLVVLFLMIVSGL